MRAASTLAVAALRRAFAADAASSAGPRPKAVLRGILEASHAPLTADAVWESAQASGLKSKRFTKTMLAQMRRSGEVRTVPAVSGKSFGYAAATPKPGREGAA